MVLNHYSKYIIKRVFRKEKREILDSIKQEEVPTYKKQKLKDIVSTIEVVVTYSESNLIEITNEYNVKL